MAVIVGQPIKYKKRSVSLLFLILINFHQFQSSNAQNLWKWRCIDNNCRRISAQDPQQPSTFPSVEVCRLVCGPSAGLWPIPTGKVSLSPQLVLFSPTSVVVSATNKEFFRDNIDYFRQQITRNTVSAASCPEKRTLSVTITPLSDDNTLSWTTDESYNLSITSSAESSVIRVEITSLTIFGARHGLETLTQLVEVHENACLATLATAEINDAPVYPHRGLLIDTARNFQPVSVIKKHVDGLAASKMNVLHWHATDTQSFSIEIANLPNVTKFGAYSTEMMYSRDDVEEVVKYARTRGVRVILEFDAPAHAGNGWQWGSDAGLGELAVCVDKTPYRDFCIQPPCGQLNPINPNLYPLLEKLYRSLVEYLPSDEVVHMGGDEVFIPCWNSTGEIVKYLNNSRSEKDFVNLWAEFQRKNLAAFDRAYSSSKRRDVILWTSRLTELDDVEEYLSKERYVIQTWVKKDDPLPEGLLTAGYRIIVSTKDAWYLDHGVWGSTVYADWMKVYNNRIPERGRGVLGGEVCMWGERFDGTSVVARTWPRTAVVAERLWSNPKGGVAAGVRVRFGRHRERLVERGVDSEALYPRYCYQDEESCFVNAKSKM